MLKSISFASLLFFVITASHGQQQVGKNGVDHLLIKLADPSGEEIKTIGSPYLKDDFLKGTIYASNNIFADVPLRYNIYKDYLEFKQGNKTYVLDPEPRIQKVRFDNSTFVVLNYEYRGKAQLGYLQQLDSGKVMLFAKKNVTYRESQPAKALESESTPAKFINMPDVYFYKIGEGEILRVESLKKMIETFPDKQTELTQFAKQEKLGVKDKEDLKKLLQYYNSL